MLGYSLAVLGCRTCDVPCPERSKMKSSVRMAREDEEAQEVRIEALDWGCTMDPCKVEKSGEVAQGAMTSAPSSP